MEDKKMLNDEDLENVNGGGEDLAAIDFKELSKPNHEEEVNWGTKVPDKLPIGIDLLRNIPGYSTQNPNSDKNNDDKKYAVDIGEMHS